MKWAHLPVTGGIYAQHPKFLDDMLVLFELDAEQRLKEQREQELKAKRKK